MTAMDLSRAVCCADCDVLFTVDERVCPVCACQTFVPLATWLNRLREPKETETGYVATVIGKRW